MILYSCILKYNLLNMATIAQDDTSDLLILSDETDTIKSDENPIIEENTSSMDDLITFDTDEIIKEETWLDMWLDLWTTEAKSEMEVKEETWLDMWLDLWTTEAKPEMEVKEETW